MVSFPRAMKTVRCQVPGCQAVSHSAVRMREHFIYRHFFYRIAVVKEGTAPLPQCELCSMHMLEGRLLKYQQTQRCNWNTQMRCRRKDVAIVRLCMEAEFSLRGEDDVEYIEGVETFKYPGSILDQSDDK